MPLRFVLAACGVLLLAGCVIAEVPATSDAQACSKVGIWLNPATGKPIAPGQLMAALAHRSVILLGEQHDKAEHHRWQLQTLAHLYARNRNIVVGFEMFPRRVQPALDRWSAGTINMDEFLSESDWEKVWGFNPGLYVSLFHFMRQNRLPMIALNVDRDLIARIGRDGWDAIPSDERDGLSNSAPASKAYLRNLVRVYVDSHSGSGQRNNSRPKEGTDYSSAMEDDAFKRFVAAQLTWDRAMAEALAAARRKFPSSLVIGILGQGHAKFGHGVPHQLADLGVTNTAVLLPVEPDAVCKGLPATIADAVFVVPP
jgi:uncharacterized iron-regulated protein